MSTPTFSAAMPVTNGLTPVSGAWTKDQAAHLLRRTLFGPKRQEINSAVTMGLAGTLNQLFATVPLPAPPLRHYDTANTRNTDVQVGQTWINSPHSPNEDVGQYRWPSLRGWYFQTVWDGPFNIMDKLAMFWMNHFGMSDVGEHRAQYQYIQLFRDIGKGSFQTMIEEITVHPSMLRFLNGDYSTRWDPNENYARELLELFTVQKGPQIAPGDYTHYTETDITEIARIMTGWRNRGMWSQANEPVESYWHQNWHDTGTKQLSYHFNNAVIQNNDADEYKDLIAVIFQQDEVAKSICREFYRFFVHYEIDATIEATVITPLADFMRANGYSVELTLRNLFSSQHFYDMAVRGPQIKSPYDFVFSIIRPMGGYRHLGLSLDQVSVGNNLQTAYEVGTGIHWWTNTMDMDFLYPPTVAGWKAYYQTPGFYRNWIGSATLKRRRKFVEDATNRGIWTRTDGDSGNYQPRGFDWLNWIAELNNPYDVNDVVDEILEIFLPRQLEPPQYDALKNQLLNGQLDSEWTVQWSSYVSSPMNPAIVNPLTTAVKNFFRALFGMAEFQLQ